jgi:hypothetical protein
MLLSTAVCLGQNSRKPEDHFDQVNQRGKSHQGMGFSQTEITHHFLLTEDGGVIQVTANNRADTDSIKKVQEHFDHIARRFAKGDFSIPHFVHDQAPPGVPTMKRLKLQIKYTKEDLPDGARLKISTDSQIARKAVHAFLVFQIRDHRTGDPEAVQAALHKK